MINFIRPFLFLYNIRRVCRNLDYGTHIMIPESGGGGVDCNLTVVIQCRQSIYIYIIYNLFIIYINLLIIDITILMIGIIR